MANSNRRASLSPSEQRIRSRSSSRSPPNIIVDEGDDKAEDIISPRSRQNTQETNLIERRESFLGNRSRASSITSITSRKQRSSLKILTPPMKNHKKGFKRKKTSVSVSELASQRSLALNDPEKQDLSNGGHYFVSPEILELITLRHLTLSHNKLSSLPSAIHTLINLEYLDVSHNPLIVKNGHDDYSCFPREFRLLKNLRTLLLADCALKHIPIAVWQVMTLQTLDISRNKVGYIVADIGNLTDLRHLRLSQMELEVLPSEIGFCRELETIDLVANPINSLPETLVECQHLYDIKLNFNRFYQLLDESVLRLINEGKIHSEHIPQVIFDLENLRTLDFKQTKINFIPYEHTLFNLTELYLSHNLFFDIPESLCTMEKLKILDMSDNRIHTIPEYFIEMQQLEILDLTRNKLTSLSQLFAHLSILKKLILRQNQLHTIEKEFSQSQSILRLDLSYNHLKSIPEEFCKLKQLELLDLRYNKFQYLPRVLCRMTGLKSMNTLDETLQRTGVHLLGNPIIDLPRYIWKSTNIQELSRYIDIKEKSLIHHFHHLKLILIGSKGIGKTTLAINLVHNRKVISKTRKTIDMYIFMLQQKQASADSNYLYDSHSKIERLYPPLLKTYRSTEVSNYFIHKSTFITKNNLYCTIVDVTSEPSFEILYPLIYDSKALYILPINLTNLLNNSQVVNDLENTNQQENADQLTTIDFSTFVTEDWLHRHIYRYLESISDQCEQVFVAIIGLIDNTQIGLTEYHQELLDTIHSRVDAYLCNEGDRHENINFYSDFFPIPIRLNNEQMSILFIEQLETIALQWNIIHHKQKQQFIKQRLGFYQQDALIISYDLCLKRFEQQKPFSLMQSNEKIGIIGENKLHLEEEINQMSFDECFDYLKLTGDILCFGQKSDMIILIKPYHILNKILGNTVFRPYIDQWLDYDNNLVFRFSGYYPSRKLFDIDRQRLLTRGEFTWKMLNVLFFEQNNDDICINNKHIFDYCRLMQRLYVGYLNESTSYYCEFTTAFFVCPWLMKEKYSNINNSEYHNQYGSNRRKQFSDLNQQQQLWISIDEDPSQTNSSITTTTSELSVIEFPEDKQDPLQTIKIFNNDSNILPDGLYERLLICLHPLLHERRDYYNLTLGKTKDKSSLNIQRFEEQNEIHLTANNQSLEHIQNLLSHELFFLYPSMNLQIETLT